MKARIMGRSIEIEESRVKSGGATAPTKTGTSTVARVSACAGASPASSPPPPKIYDSRLEERYARYLDCLLFAKEIHGYVYHPFSMRLPGPRNYHRPDFLVVRHDGGMELHNTKGTYHKNIRDSLTKIKVAAGMYPWFTFLIIKRIEHQWIRQRVMEG